MKSRADQDKQMEMLIGMILRSGVSLAAAIVAAGGVVFLWSAGTAQPNYHSFRATSDHGQSVASVFNGVGRLDGASIITLGILVLIATPVARVLLMLFAFLRERDLLYVAFSAIVLAVLAYSMLS